MLYSQVPAAAEEKGQDEANLPAQEAAAQAAARVSGTDEQPDRASGAGAAAEQGPEALDGLIVGLPRRLRLGPARRVREVARRGRRVGGRIGVLCYLPGETSLSRLGQSFARRLGTAVARNRARRRLQEAFLRLEPEISGAWDLFLRAGRGAMEADGCALRHGFEELLREAGLLE